MKSIQMKINLTYAVCSAFILLGSCGAPADESNANLDKKEISQEEGMTSLTGGTYFIDVDASAVNWRGSEITGKDHKGTIDIYKGSIEVVDETISKAFVAIDMNSMAVTDEDMSEDSKNNLLGHLKSEDFFGVEKFQDSQIFIEGVKVKEGVPNVYGKIIIRRIPQPIHFPVTLSQDDGVITVDASLTFDRSKHDVKFRSGAFPDLFPNLGDKLINDDIELDVHIVASPI